METKKILVFDDDPTGTQTVHGIYVYTDWRRETLKRAILDGRPMSYILTNSRSFTRAQTVGVHGQIAKDIADLQRELGREVVLISRSDSTLRGHYPDETEAFRENLSGPIDGEVLIPFFAEGGRITRDNVHFLWLDGEYVPVHRTEFAKDVSFGYRHSHLGDWVEEKTDGRYRRDGCMYIPVGQDEQETYRMLRTVAGFQKVIVNAVTYDDLYAFTRAVLRAMDAGKRFIFRTAAAFPKVIGGCADIPLLTRSEVLNHQGQGALIVVGSHVRNTTDQLAHLKANHPEAMYLEFDVAAALVEGGLAAEAARLLHGTEDILREGGTAVIFTSRTPLRSENMDADSALQLSVRISQALTGIVAALTVRPRYVLAKGGITSSDVAVKGLGLQKALVLGQIQKGIPVWQAGEESKFPLLPYIVFPGNVGEPNSLSRILEALAA